MTLQQNPAFPPAPAAPTSLIEPSPMGTGALLKTAWRLVTHRLGLLARAVITELVVSFLLMLLPVILVVALGLAIASATSRAGVDHYSATNAVMAVLLVILAYVLMLVGPIWASIKYTAVQTVILDQAARGMAPSWEAATAHTRGIGRRALSLILVVLGISVVVAVLYSIFLGLAVASSHGGVTGGSAAASMVVLLLGLVATIGGIYLAVRLAYVNQVLAVERLSGMAILRRSMQLTKGRFWPTLGNMIVGGLVFYVVVAIAAGIVSSLASNDNTRVAALVLGALVYLAIAFCSGIWTNGFTTTMYIDQVRRHAQQGIAPVEVAPVAGAGLPGTFAAEGAPLGASSWGAAPTGTAPTGTAPVDTTPADTWGQQPVGPLGTPAPRPQSQAWDAGQSPSAEQAGHISGEEPTRTFGDESTQQISGQEPTRTIDESQSPWDRPDDQH